MKARVKVLLEVSKCIRRQLPYFEAIFKKSLSHTEVLTEPVLNPMNPTAMTTSTRTAPSKMRLLAANKPEPAT